MFLTREDNHDIEFDTAASTIFSPARLSRSMADVSDMINPTPSEDHRANALESYNSFAVRNDKIVSFLHQIQTLQVPSFEYMMFICGAVGNSAKMQKKLFCIKDKKKDDDSYLTGGYIIFVKWLSYAVQSIEDDPILSARGRRVDAMAIAGIIDLIRNCSVIKTVGQIEILMNKFNVDWFDIVEKVRTIPLDTHTYVYVHTRFDVIIGAQGLHFGKYISS